MVGDGQGGGVVSVSMTAGDLRRIGAQTWPVVAGWEQMLDRSDVMAASAIRHQAEVAHAEITELRSALDRMEARIEAETARRIERLAVAS